MASVLYSSTEYLLYPWDGPTSLTQDQLEALPVYVALIPDTGGDEPEDKDYAPAAWLGHEVAFKPGMPKGTYRVYGRIVCDASGEDVRKFIGRLRIGDTRD